MLRQSLNQDFQNPLTYSTLSAPSLEAKVKTFNYPKAFVLNQQLHSVLHHLLVGIQVVLDRLQLPVAAELLDESIFTISSMS